MAEIADVAEQKDLKPQEDKPASEESTEQESTSAPEKEPETTSEGDSEAQVGDDLQSPEEITEDLLSDKTSAEKQVSIPYDKFKDINEKSQIYERFAPLLAKLTPEKVEEILNIKENTLENRINELEEEKTLRIRTEVKSAVEQAEKLWPDFHKQWPNMKPLVRNLVKEGMSYHQAVERSYFAVNPDAINEGKRMAAQTVQNQQGVMSTAGGQTVRVTSSEGEYTLSAADQEVASLLNIDPKLYSKHQESIKGWGYDKI